MNVLGLEIAAGFIIQLFASIYFYGRLVERVDGLVYRVSQLERGDRHRRDDD